MTTTHHARLLYASDIAAVLVAPLVGEAEVHDSTYEKFGVADAQQLVLRAHIQPAEAARQTFVLRTHFITLEAQNALLKVVEEPPAATTFLLVVPTDFTVLPTLLSRCERLVSDVVVIDDSAFTTFVAATYAERLAQIEQAQKKKDTQWQRLIKQGLIAYVSTRPAHLAELEYSARLLLTRGASNKFLLEHAALLIPPRSTI